MTTWETRRRDILAGVRAVDAPRQGVIVLTDMFGGTPSNLAISIMDKASVEVIAGVNLPMLIKLAGLRDSRVLNDAAAKPPNRPGANISASRPN